MYQILDGQQWRHIWVVSDPRLPRPVPETGADGSHF